MFWAKQIYNTKGTELAIVDIKVDLAMSMVYAVTATPPTLIKIDQNGDLKDSVILNDAENQLSRSAPYKIF